MLVCGLRRRLQWQCLSSRLVTTLLVLIVVILAVHSLLDAVKLLHGPSWSSRMEMCEPAKEKELEEDDGSLEEEVQYLASLDPDFKSRDSELAIYSLKGDRSMSQRVWEMSNVCFNGSNLVAVGNARCRDGSSFFPNGPVVPVPCNYTSFWQAQRNAGESGFGPVESRPQEWLRSRKIRWHLGTSCLINLERATTNIAHLHARVNLLLLMNLATVPAFSDVVSRFLFRIAPEGIGQYLEPGIVSPENENPYHATYLTQVLRMVNMRALEGRRLKVTDILGAKSAASGRVEFNGSLVDASEDYPVCFQKALVPGFLKTSYWPGGLAMADRMRKRLYRQSPKKIKLALMSPTTLLPSDPPLHLLYIVRNKTGTFKRRQFGSASSQTMLSAVAATGLPWRAVELVGMDFWQQVALMKEADISISLHGANLLNPSLLQRRDTILIELIPFKVVHHVYEELALAAGIIYIGLQLLQGQVQWLDAVYANLTAEKCMAVPLCKMYHVHNRTVELTVEDDASIRLWLQLARAVVKDIPAMREQPVWDAELWQRVSGRVVGFPRLVECGRREVIKRSGRLGRAWISYRDAGDDADGFKTCTWNQH